MADMGFVFTTVFLVSYEFVKTVLLDFSPSTATETYGQILPLFTTTGTWWRVLQPPG